MRQRRNRGNVLIGLGLGAFVLGVYSYSIWAVKQEDMSDVDERALIQRQLEEKKLQQQQQSN
jgi:cytochrome c oxidase assembly factor 3